MRAQLLRLRSEVAFLGWDHISRYDPDQPRDDNGRFGEGGGGGSASGGSGGTAVRDVLASAKTTSEVGAAAAAEARSITGRDIPFEFHDVELQLAREYSEGVLQGLERFPEAPLGAVRTADFPAERDQGNHTWAHTLTPEATTTGQYEIEFNRNGEVAQRANEILAMKEARGAFAYGDVRGLALTSSATSCMRSMAPHMRPDDLQTSMRASTPQVELPKNPASSESDIATQRQPAARIKGSS